MYLYTHTSTHTNTHTKTNNFFFFPLNKMQVLQISFSFVGASFLTTVALGKGVFGSHCSRSCWKGVPSAPDHLPTPCTHQLLLQISSCSLQGMLISSRQGREKPQGWIKDEARRATRSSVPSRDRLALE